jgi:hypothetical protein
MQRGHGISDRSAVYIFLEGAHQWSKNGTCRFLLIRKVIDLISLDRFSCRGLDFLVHGDVTNEDASYRDRGGSIGHRSTELLAPALVMDLPLHVWCVYVLARLALI